MTSTEHELSTEDLIEAMSDDVKAEELLARTGMSREELIQSAEAVARGLSSEISTLNVV